MINRLLYLGNKLSKHGLTPTVIEMLGPALEKEGFELIYASDKKNKLLRLLDMIFKILLHSRRVNYVLIDTYSTSNFYYALLVSQLCRLLQLNYIPILHGGNLPSRLENNPYLSGLIFTNAWRNVAPSSYLQIAFLDHGYKNVIHIPNALDVSEHVFFQRTLLQPKLLWVRSFAKIYNPKMAIKVFSELQKNFPGAQLCMVGPDKENLIAECKLYAAALGVSVQFTGKLSKNEWIALSKYYNVFINTSHFDNTPLSVMEAMAVGLPVVSSNVGGIPYLLEHESNALLVPDDGIEEMVKQVTRLVREPELSRRLIVNGNETISRFDWKIVKNQWLELLH